MEQKRNLLLMFLLLPVFALAQQKDNKAGKALTQSDSLTVKQLFYSALREKTIENFKLASEIFSQVLQVDPRNDASMYELATLKKVENDYPSAQELLEKAVAVNPRNEWYWVSLADCYEKSNNIDKLENVFTQLLKIDPDKPEYYFDQANVYTLQKKYDEALAIYEKLEQMQGLSDEIVSKKESLYLKQGKVDKAANDLQSLIDANPKEIRYYLLLSEIYNSNNFQDKALKVLKNAEKFTLRWPTFIAIKKITKIVLMSLFWPLVCPVWISNRRSRSCWVMCRSFRTQMHGRVHLS